MSHKNKKAQNKGKRPMRVLFLPVDDGGCGWMRVRQLHEAFQNRTDVQSVLLEGKEDPNEQARIINDADIIVARLGDYAYVKLIKEDINPLKPIVFDHDDNTMEVLPTSEHYREFGTQDVIAQIRNENGEIVEERPIWVTGVTQEFNRYKNLQGQMNLMYILGSADMITAPVQNLIDYYKEFCKADVATGLVLNCLNFDLFPEGEFIRADKPEGEIRIGWEGGVSHMGDWQEIKEPLEKIMDEFPEVKLYIHGSYYKNQFKAFEDRIIRGGWYPFKGYTYKIKTMALDGALIPLESKSFNEYKSELKFTEFSGLEIPCLVKDMLPYSRVIKDGENCWTYKDNEEFETKLREMILDIKNGKKKCNKFVTNAKKWVKEERNIEVEAGKVVELYKSILPEDTLRELL